MKHTFKLTLIAFVVFQIVSCARNTADNKNQTKSANMKNVDVLIGVYTGQESKGIYKVSFDQETGELSDKTLLVASENPSYITQSHDGKFVFSVNETSTGSVSSYKWNSDKSALIDINKQSTQGMHPCYVSVHPTLPMLAAANYSSGNIAVYHIENGGSIKADPQVRQHKGSGPVLPNQDNAHAHCSIFDANGKYLYVADLGIDKVVAYAVDASGNLGAKHNALDLDAGDGPRHIVFHPSKDYVFVINELSGSVIAAHVDHNSGMFHPMDKKSTLPAGFSGKNACADIHVSPDGKFLYASNRGHNSLAIFSIGEDGRLTSLGHESVKGEVPRNFAISPNGKYILVANQGTNNITVFKRDIKSGLLTFTGNEIHVEKPVCLQFAK